MTYFKPLLNWLVTENVRHGEILGWPDFSCSLEQSFGNLTLIPPLFQPQTLPSPALGQSLCQPHLNA